jgi:carbon-monoxide dehydrogenase iron sulfur subunit
MTDLELYELDAEGFRRLSDTSEPFSVLLNRISKDRLIRQTPIFSELSDDSIRLLDKRFNDEVYPERTVVFREGEPAQALYIIVKGGVQVSKETKSGKARTIAYLGPGDVFGEMGLIEKQPRSATVQTLEATKLLVLPADEFHSLLRQSPLISFHMLKVLSRRLREEGQQRASEGSFFKGLTIVARPERCLACKACEVACAVSKSRTRTLLGAIGEEPLPVKRIRVRRSESGPQPVSRPEHCLHCRDAPCLASCNVDAITRDPEERVVVIHDALCRGCGLCARACPFNAITMIRTGTRKRVALKCTHCAEHEGGPACVRSCPTNTLVISLPTMSAS